jgi:GTP-binding protein EngB required for normal cell division
MSEMNSQYYHGLPENATRMRVPHYPGHDYAENIGEYEAPPSYSTVLDSVSLGREEENAQLLNQIDKLRECGVDEYIDLPQIVVVGDQSSGKSSVLEALTNIPFPRSNVRCTRFATQIRLRRANNAETKIRILPGEEQSLSRKQELAAFEQKCQDQTDFDTIFDRAKDAIFPTGAASAFLSRSILSIEISGPDQPHLTVVDLPGIIHSATMNQTEADKKAITTLANSYMQKERTIILLVVSGSNDISNQIVLGMAKVMDLKGTRTLGIITKPDMTETKERRKEFIDLASNKDPRNRLHLGWHVLRNRTPDEMHFTPEERKRAEIDFFAGTEWGTKLKPNQLGVDALSKDLSTQLIRHIAAEAYKVEADIERELRKCREKLAQLGDGKDTIEEMRAELYRWCDRSRRLAQAAVQGHGINPAGEDFFLSSNDSETYARNFRSCVVEKNYAFAAQMEDWGSACLIIEDENQKRKTSKRADNSEMQIEEISKSDYISKVIYPMLRDNRGLELSVDSNPLLVYRLFQTYSKNWPDHATQDVADVYKLCVGFLHQILQVAWPKQLQNRVWVGFIQHEVDWRLKKAQMELNKLKNDRMKHVTPYESDFVKKYYQWKEADIAKQGSVDLPVQKYEDVLRKMLLLYEVSCS